MNGWRVMDWVMENVFPWLMLAIMAAAVALACLAVFKYFFP
jgi:hypothetical protein